MRISDWSSDVCSSDLAARDKFRATLLMFIIVLLVITVIIPLLRSLHLPQCWRRRCYYRMYPLLRGRALHPEQEVVLCLRSGRRRDQSSHRLPYHQRLPCRAWRRPVHYSRPCRPRTRTIKPLRREKTGQEGDKTSIIIER